MLFKNREEAGNVLAQRLALCKRQKPVVLAGENKCKHRSQPRVEAIMVNGT